MNSKVNKTKSIFGAIIGDIVGSRFEFDNIKSKDFELFDSECSLTDDSYMTIACAKALLEYKSGLRDLSEIAKECFRSIGREYQSSYGKQFHLWLISEDPKPYNSFGNGSAMRISPVAYVSTGIEEVKTLSRKITEVSHNHPEGIKGAEATAIATYLALSGKDKNSIKKYISDNYYNLDFKLDDIRDSYKFDGSCQGTVPFALEAFFESSGFEDAIRNAISIGGDSDTIGAICGGVAGAYYGVPEDLVLEAKKKFRFKEDLLKIIRDFEEKYCKRI